MAQKVPFNYTLILTLAATALLFSVALVWSVRADGGVVLHPPFNGTYRVTAYFDHDRPTYCIGANSVITIYNGEGVSANCSTQTGEPYPYDGHDGWDWSMGTGTDILAAAAGTVVLSTDDWGGNNSCYGRTIVIDHGNGYYTQYSHLSNRLVNVGDPVAAGQHIADSGNTSDPNDPDRCPVGAHLHFGVRHGGYLNTSYAVDPFGWRGSGRDPLFDYNGKESSCLWAGVPGDDISCADIIVEDDAPDQPYDTWMEWGTWFDSTNGNGYREHHTYSWDYASSYAYWLPVIPAQGYYQVYAFVPPISSRTTNAEYLVRGIPEETVYRDQSGTAPRWMSLGTFEFAAGYSSNTWVRLYDYTGESQYSHWVAADSMKFSASVVYLPDVRNSGGWTSSIVIRNNSTSSAKVGINYYNSSGSRVSYQTTTIAGNGSKTKIPPSDFSGSAVVVASQDVSVVVENIYDSSGRYLAAAHPGETAPAATVYAPYVVKRWPSGHPSWRQTTDLIIQNTGTQQASVTITFYDSWGSTSTPHEETRTIPVNGQITLSGTEMPTWEGSLGTLASAVVRSDQPVAVVARTYTGDANSSGVIDTPYLVGSYRAFTSGADEVYMPVAAAEYYNYDSSLQVQNARNGNTTFQVKYYYPDGSLAIPALEYTVGAYRSVNLWRPSGLSGFLGSAVVDVISGGPMVAMAQYDTFNTSQSRYGVNQYEGVTAGTRSEVLPHVRWTSPWDWTGIMAQNMGGSKTDITLNFYEQSGSPADPSDIEVDDVYPKAAALYWGTSMPLSISGSAVASSDPEMPVALVVNFDRSESWMNKDRMMGYGAVK